MDPLQTVFGLFENAAEAQQAVQLLLAEGFTQDTVTVSTHPYPGIQTGKRLTTRPETDQSSGRFLASLFGERQLIRLNQTNSGPGESTPGESTPGNMLVIVQTQSVVESRQVANLLEGAGSINVTVQNGKCREWDET